MPAEFISNFEPTYPIVLGGLLSAEQNVGYVTVGTTFAAVPTATSTCVNCFTDVDNYTM